MYSKPRPSLTGFCVLQPIRGLCRCPGIHTHAPVLESCQCQSHPRA
ncbi:MAG: hypothetical protein EXQ52_13155 [Bryobacterales bacterium]|nr:hypothetical protein [Bryobacterales bacterium]